MALMTTNTIHTNDRRRRVERVLGFTAGIAVTLAAGYMFAASITDAAGNGEDTTFIPITPCRLFDTRPAPDTVGPRSTPLGAGDTLVQQVTGANGACTIPAGATAVALNATAVGATAPSFGTFYPADATRPVASNLNYVPGQPPTPNKVDVKLSADGKVAVYNAFGQVDMIADVTGYYTTATIGELSAAVDLALASRSFSAGESTNSLFANGLDTTEETVLSLTMTAPVAGAIVANYATIVDQGDAGETVECQVSTIAGLGSTAFQRFESPGANGSEATLAGTRRLTVAAGETIDVLVNCRSSDATASTRNTQLTAIFTPDVAA
jgi:hypothetical protein